MQGEVISAFPYFNPGSSQVSQWGTGKYLTNSSLGGKALIYTVLDPLGINTTT